MMQLLDSVMQVEGAIALFAALAAFATVLTIAAPFFENDKLQARTKLVTSERDRLRAQQKAALEANGSGRLRDRKTSGVYSRLVEMLNLRKVFEAEATQDMLRSAGFRRERHLTMFLAFRVIVPLFVGAGVFAYTTIHMSNSMNAGMRVAASFVGMVIGSYIPGVVVRNLGNKRKASIKKAWSDALDLLLICVESGMALEPGMQRVAKEIGSQSVALAEELQLTVAELAYLPERRKAFENLAKRTKLETVKSVVTALIQSERYGTPLGSALRVLAEENRKDRMSEAERKAAALPPKLTVPMILFFLPVIFVVILGPSVLMVMQVKH